MIVLCVLFKKKVCRGQCCLRQGYLQSLGKNLQSDTKGREVEQMNLYYLMSAAVVFCECL